jgi:hypothetical protein
MNITKLKALFNLYNKAQKIREQELADFMKFYKSVVEMVPPEAARIFGNMSVPTYVHKDKAVKNYGIKLTVVDYAWWVSEFKAGNCYFVDGPASVKRDILNKLTKTVENYLTTPELKKELMEILVGE